MLCNSFIILALPPPTLPSTTNCRKAPTSGENRHCRWQGFFYRDSLPSVRLFKITKKGFTTLFPRSTLARLKAENARREIIQSVINVQLVPIFVRLMYAASRILFAVVDAIAKNERLVLEQKYKKREKKKLAHFTQIRWVEFVVVNRFQTESMSYTYDPASRSLLAEFVIYLQILAHEILLPFDYSKVRFDFHRLRRRAKLPNECRFSWYMI